MNETTPGLSRRRVLQSGGAGAGGLMLAGCATTGPATCLFRRPAGPFLAMVPCGGEPQPRLGLAQAVADYAGGGSPLHGYSQHHHGPLRGRPGTSV